MSYNEYEEMGEGFKVSGIDEDEPLDPMEEMPREEIPDIDEDPDDRYQ
jgi:hypothetical protein